MTSSIRRLQQGVEVMFRKVCMYLVTYCTLYQFRHILQVTNWTKISEVINSSFFVARIFCSVSSTFATGCSKERKFRTWQELKTHNLTLLYER